MALSNNSPGKVDKMASTQVRIAHELCVGRNLISPGGKVHDKPIQKGLFARWQPEAAGLDRLTR